MICEQENSEISSLVRQQGENYILNYNKFHTYNMASTKICTEVCLITSVHICFQIIMVTSFSPLPPQKIANKDHWHLNHILV